VERYADSLAMSCELVWRVYYYSYFTANEAAIDDKYIVSEKAYELALRMDKL